MMENQFIFRLKRPIVFPVSSGDNQGMIVYNTRDFALGYRVAPNPKEKEPQITLLIYRVSDEAVIRSIATFNITELGFPTGVVLNEADIAKQVKARIDLQAEIEYLQNLIPVLYAEEAALIEAGEDTVNISGQILEATNHLSEDRLQLAILVIPEPILEYGNKYSDVIDYFDKDGSITLEGIEWAKGVPFLGLTLKDYLA